MPYARNLRSLSEAIDHEYDPSVVRRRRHESMAILDRLDVSASRLLVRFKFGKDASVRLLSQMLEIAWGERKIQFKTLPSAN